MRKSLSFVVVGLICAVSAFGQMPGQRPPGPPMRPRPPVEEGPKGEKKLRWICKQLQLDEKQHQQAEALIATYTAQLAEDQKDPTALMQRLQAKVAELQAAKEKGDTAAVEKIQAELRNMAPGMKAENDYFESLSQVLTAEQKAKLPAIREKAEKIGSIAMRPIHVLWAARHQSLSPDQERELEKALESFRTTLQTDRDTSPDASAKRVDQLVQDVRKILKPEQAAKYDKEIEDMRDGAPAAEKIEWPAPKTPAAPPAAPLGPTAQPPPKP